MISKNFSPKLATVLREGISTKQLSQDVLAGIIVGVVALPLAIAFAIASGVSPEKGLVTAIFAGFVISFLGGSRVQIGGPTGAFIVIVYGIVQEFGISGLTIATFIAGFLLIIMGLARFGNLLKYIPYPLIVGFTSGIALLIFSTQIKDLLGLHTESLPADFLSKWKIYFTSLDTITPYAALMGLITILISFNFHRVTKKIPGSLVAIILCTLLVQLFDLPIETIETRFGSIPNNIPSPRVPGVDFATLQHLIAPAFAIALLGGIESLLSAVVADGMIGSSHRSNMELVAQGAANIVSSIFGGIPATGAIARTATNIKNGGRTPIAGIVHAITLLLIMLILAPYAKLIPLSCLAGILVVVSYHMGEWHNFFTLLKSNKMDTAVLLVTFFLTVIFDLVLAIEVGMVLSAFLFMKRMADVTQFDNKTGILEKANKGEEVLFEEEIPELPEGVLLYEINGPLFFGAAQRFQDTLRNIHVKPQIIILRMRNVSLIDATGLYRLKETIKFYKHKNISIILSGIQENIKEELTKADVFEIMNKENALPSISESVKRAQELMQTTKTDPVTPSAMVEHA
ncbi:MAG: SulP family inorganic anion transporter [Marinifilaceae bacterium]